MLLTVFEKITLQVIGLITIRLVQTLFTVFEKLHYKEKIL